MAKRRNGFRPGFNDLRTPPDPGLFETPTAARYGGTADPPGIATTYRYELTRQWRIATGDEKPIHFCGLNPAGASATTDDHTLGRYTAYGQALDFPGLIATNPFGYRTADPNDLLTVADPIGERTDTAIARAAYKSALTIVCWGNGPAGADGRALMDSRIPAVLSILYRAGVTVMCLGVTSAGNPVHLARLPNGRKPQPYPIPERYQPLTKVALP